MIAKAPERNSRLGRSLDVAVGTLGILSSPLAALYYFNHEAYLPPPRIIDDNMLEEYLSNPTKENRIKLIEESPCLNEFKEYPLFGFANSLQRASGRLRLYLARQKALILGRDIEFADLTII